MRRFVSDREGERGQNPRRARETCGCAARGGAPDDGGDGTDEPTPTTYGGEIFGGRDDRYLSPGNWIDVPGIEGGMVFVPASPRGPSARRAADVAEARST